MEHRPRGIGGSISVSQASPGALQVCIVAPSRAVMANQAVPAAGVLDP